MRVSKDKAVRNRTLLLDSAARLVRQRGMAGVGVDQLSEAAGLTHGSVYSHFGSKDALLAEAVRHAFADFAAEMRDYQTMPQFVARYLSPAHRDNVGAGCSVAALGCEMPRQDKALRQVFTDCVKQTLERIGKRLAPGPRRAREDEVLGIVSTLIGAMVLARAVDDPALSDRVLKAGRARLRSAA